MGVHDKIKKYLKENYAKQLDFANTLGISQKDVSKMVSGQKKFIPNEYFEFFIKKGYDLNTLFDDEQPLKKIDSTEKIVHEPKARYLQRTDIMQKNQLIPVFNIEAAAGLVELFQHVDEKTPIDFISIPHLPKCDGAVFVTGDSMYPLLKSGDIIIYKQINNIEEGIFWGEIYLVSVDLDGDEYISVKYIQKSDIDEKHVKLVSQNSHHQPKEILKSRIRALAMVKASVRINGMR